MSAVTRKTALALYGVLIVLPAVVFGGLHWQQLLSDQRSLLAAVPGDTAGAAERLEGALVRAVRELVEREDERPFYEYRRRYFPAGTLGAELAFVPSRLAIGPSPAPILGWFSHSAQDLALGRESRLLLGEREGAPDAQACREELRRAVDALRERERAEDPFLHLFRTRQMRSTRLSLPVVAINISEEDDVECLREELPSLRAWQDESQRVQTSTFHLRFFRDAGGTPRAIATRNVYVPPNQQLANMPACFESLGRGTRLVQGFVLDPHWLLEQLPALLATQVLGAGQRLWLREPPAGAGSDEVFAVQPIKALAFEVADPADRQAATLWVAGSAADLERRFASQGLRLLGVAAMLVVSLLTGVLLLVRSVRRDLESVARTENFVAAVTHELRTPLAVIKLYGEMLQDGWADTPEKRGEYYRRIVRETTRLETLVERVLEQSQVTRGELQPEPGDLEALVGGMAPALSGLAPDGARDLEFRLQPGLPPVQLIPDGVRSIVTNLVENARKYAPPGPEGEPILVELRLVGGAVALEVSDRGPGIPDAERERIFEAFYRIGDERTRRSRGTGLGLHLVALLTQAMSAQVSVHDREGGGTTFRVTFLPAAALTRA